MTATETVALGRGGKSKTMTNQPYPLPKTLPAGTRNSNGVEFLTEGVLRPVDGTYQARLRYSDGHEGEGAVHVRTLDWPTPASDRPIQIGDWLECVDARSSGGALVVGNAYQVALIPNPTNVGFDVDKPAAWWSISRFRRAEAPRPIQAGDWVECVNAYSDGGLGLVRDHRYEVASLAGDGRYLELVGVRHPLIGWALERFKRVDGPHPVEPGGPFIDPEAIKALAVADVCACGGGVFLDRACIKCRAPMVEAKPDPYTAYRLDSEVAEEMATRVSEIKPRRRNEDALRREAERPRLTADARELAKPHPWEEFE